MAIKNLPAKSTTATAQGTKAAADAVEKKKPQITASLAAKLQTLGLMTAEQVAEGVRAGKIRAPRASSKRQLFDPIRQHLRKVYSEAAIANARLTTEGIAAEVTVLVTFVGNGKKRRARLNDELMSA